MKLHFMAGMVVSLCGTALAQDGRSFEAWARAEVAKCRQGTQSVISFPAGVHHARAENATPKTLHLSNNDDGLKHLLFDLSGLENVVIDGQGAELVLHGHLIPFYMKNAKNITIRNLTLDWEHPLFGQGTVTDCGTGWFDVQFDPQYPVAIENGELLFLNPDLPEPMRMRNINFYDPQFAHLAYRTTDEYGVARVYTAERLDGGAVRIRSEKLQSRLKPGYVAVFQYDGRSSPAVAVQRSENIRLENVVQYHAAAMANLFEGSRNIYLDNVQVVRRPGSGRWFSAHHDAAHYVDCRGDIHIRNCRFEYQGDDACNIHGVFRPVYAHPAPDQLRVKLIHFQQMGVDTLFPGDPIGFYHADTLELLGEGVLKSVSALDAQQWELVFQEKLPALDWTKMVVAVRDHNIDVRISGSRFAFNRARGLLINTLGKVRIHDNYFKNQGSAIEIKTDASNWYEAGPVEDVEIHGNVFDQCNTGGFSAATFEIEPVLNKRDSDTGIFKNIRIHHNTIHQIFKPLLIASHTENLEFHDNGIMPGKDYPMWSKRADDPRNVRLGAGVVAGRMQNLD